MSIEAMKQALEALDGLSEPYDVLKAQHALRTAIAEVEKQEPVAWLEPEWGEKICPEVGYEVTMTDDHPKDLCWIPLYTTPPAAQRQWVGFTDEEINEYDYEHRDFIYDIEALLKHKNTRLG